MAPNPRLDEAVAIFTELGWADATYADAPTLPLGTPAQKRAALAGLRTGEWGERRWDRRWTWVSYVGVDEVMLWLFTIRLGVGAKRAATAQPGGSAPGRFPNGKLSDGDQAAAFEDTLFAVLAERGPAFARTFVRQAAKRCPDAVVRLVAHHRLPAPVDRDYLDAWQAAALACLGSRHGGSRDQTVRPETVFRDRFVDHVSAAFASGRGEGILGAVLAGVKHGWVDRDTIVDLVLTSMDASPGAGRNDPSNPAQRWLKVWLEDLHATDCEIVARGESLVPVLAGGDPFMIERLAPVLIAGVDDELLSDVATVSLTAPTKKALHPVLKALAARSRPCDQTCEVVGSQVVALDIGHDTSLARAVRTVVDRWGLEPADAEPGVRGLWRPTPPLWQVPRFDRGEQTPEALTRLATELAARGRSQVCDVVVERFLAVANTVARRDPALARAALGGLRDQWGAGVGVAEGWAVLSAAGRAGELTETKDRSPLRARELAVFRRLGEVPCLLSEPSTVDLRIDPADLLARLVEYQAAGAWASEADLYLALTRLRTDASRELRARFSHTEVPVLFDEPHEAGRGARLSAGLAVSRYLADPIVEPDSHGPIVPAAQGWWSRRRPRPDDAAVSWTPPGSLHDFPYSLGPDQRRLEVLPGWRDTLLADGSADPSSLGVLLRQVARRSTPFPSRLALSALAACHDPHPHAASDVALALDEAWQRGLLRPGAANTQADWDGSRTLPAMSRVLADAAQRGMASVVWPVLDDLLVQATSQPRMAAGTADLVGVVADLLPEVHHAVAGGLAEPASLDLPGVRALAARPGSSQAVTIARQIASELPARAEPAQVAVVTGPSFDEVWPAGADAPPTLVDGAKIAVSWVGPGQMRVDLALPDHPDVQLQVVKKYHDGVGYRDVLDEGQCKARLCGPDDCATVDSGEGAAAVRARPSDSAGRRSDYRWLFWDDQAKRLTVGEHRNRETDDNTRPRTAAPPLSTSLVAVALAMAVQDSTDEPARRHRGADGEHLVIDLVTKNLIGSAAVRIAAAALLDSPAVDPAKLARLLERHPDALPTLWPLLTEPIRVAGASTGALPQWLNRVLDITTCHANHLREAARRGLIPADAASWPGLEGLASRSGKTAALRKARTLLTVLRGE